MDTLPGANDTWFYFFDQAHCRGFDVKTLFKILQEDGNTYVERIIKITGYVALSAKNTLNEVAQAAFRLRHVLTDQQRIILLYPRKNITSFIPPPSSSSSVVYEYLDFQQSGRYRSRETSLQKQITDAIAVQDISRIQTTRCTEWFMEVETKRQEELQKRLSETNRIIEKEVVIQIENDVDVELDVGANINIHDTLSDRKREICALFRTQEKNYSFTDAEDKANEILAVVLYNDSGDRKYTLCKGFRRLSHRGKEEIFVLSPKYGNFDMHFILKNQTIFIRDILKQHIGARESDDCDVYWYIVYILLVHNQRAPTSCAFTILHNLRIRIHEQTVQTGGKILDQTMTEYLDINGTYNPVFTKTYDTFITTLQNYAKDIQVRREIQLVT
jgi:hypothetical protein